MKQVGALKLAGLLVLLLAAAAHATTYLVLPFENQTKNASLEWMGESFAESFYDRLAAPDAHVATRDERAAAFERLGIPVVTTLSRATMIKLAETMDADYIIVGRYSQPSPQQLKVSAQVIEMKTPRLSPTFTEMGDLKDLLDIQDRVALDIARAYESSIGGLPSIPLPPRHVRLDAWENYIRGLIAPAQPQQIRYFTEAFRLDPSLRKAALNLGRIYFQNRDYSSAIPWFSNLKPEDANYLESKFLLGLCYFLLEKYDEAQSAFQEVAQQMPLNEVMNNLGAVESRRNKRSAGDEFRKAAEGDPNDPDYQFNLGYWHWKNGQYAQAVKSLQKTVEKRPADAEARALLVRALERSGNSAEASAQRQVLAADAGASRYVNADSSVFTDLERIKRNYDENSFRQLQMTLAAVTEQSLAALPKEKHAAAHLQRGRDMVREQNDVAAVTELQEAAQLEPDNAETHLLLARVYERTGKYDDAVREAEVSSRLHPSIDAHLLLAKIYLQQNKLAEARREAGAVLNMEPRNVAAESILKTVQMRTQ